MRSIKFVSLLFTLMFQTIGQASTVAESQQLIVVSNTNANSPYAKMYRYERSDTQQQWQLLGQSIPVIVGKKGITTSKKEGDLSSPVGIFPIGTAFGIAEKPDFAMKLSYLPITDSTVCVDDSKSKFYNQIIDSNIIEKTTWTSGEQMKEKMPQYTLGLVINYNLPNPKPGAGSCIFMHVWNPSKSGTAGCVSMSLENMKQLLTWLDPNKKPLLVIASVKDYKDLQKLAYLPQITSETA